MPQSSQTDNDAVVATPDAQRLGVLLMSRGWKLSVAESCTGGLLGGAITAVPGSSAYFRGGVIAYDNDAKTDIIRVPCRTIAEHGAVSGETVEAMAEGVAALFSTECAISISGIAGPGGGTRAKPVGLVYIGLKVKSRTTRSRCLFTGDRDRVRQSAVREALRLLLAMIEGKMGPDPQP